ncbi:5-oxoprolinase subunit PxpB [Flavihumibacter sp. UBA7668]|uniref:5-oxoprolinase subunit PxpB n=1 Tax=Flavihumibacter sp. UBA7668 TaxID=1946542 RepID=UPI0025B88D6E|nr:5-oxoprolinase subunit PxpB [Flavihumibacter sp. UBA7668]
MANDDHFHIYPIAESAITIEYGKEIAIEANQVLLRLQQRFHTSPFSGFIDTSITYNSLSVFFDPRQLFSEGQPSPLAFVLNRIKQNLKDFSQIAQEPFKGTHHLVPVCYEGPLAPDLDAVAGFHKTDPDSIVHAHCAQDWYVFMIGFNPGFSYMGILPDTLAMPRKSSPALQVPAGSVGIAGKQTGIYPNSSPAGWQIIGRTPLLVFNTKESEPCLFKAGDTVRFTRIDLETFQYLNQHANP